MLQIVSKTQRDSQKTKVYKSGWALYASPHNKRFGDIQEIEKFVAKVWKSKRFRKAYPMAASLKPPEVNFKQGRRATGGFWEVRLPKWAFHQGVVLHELAHTVNQRQVTQGASHGWEFCAIFLKLVLWFMGREAHDFLKAEFKKNKVKFTAPRAKRVLTEEQKAVMVERLKKAREAKLQRQPTGRLRHHSRIAI